MTATIKFLTGRRAHVEGFTFRDDAGVLHNDEFLVVGIAPAKHGPDTVQVQDVIDGDVTIVDVSHVHPI